MTLFALETLREALIARGYDASLTAPNGTMDFSDGYLSALDLGDFLDLLICRREKTFRSVPVVGHDVARESYDDVVAAVEATKEVIRRLTST